MYSLRKFPGRTGIIGKPLPAPFPSFEMHKVTFRYGATSMIAGRPGSFKSVLALNIMVQWAKAGKSVLYFSADSDEFVVFMRVGAMLTGDSTDVVEGNLIRGNFASYTGAMSQLGHSLFVYQQSDVDEIASHMATFEHLFGAYPDAVFIDNLLNCVDSGEEWQQMLTVTKELDGMARETQSHICILHHTSEAVGVAGDPPPSWAVQGKITQIPRLVLTVAASGMGLYWSCVKNTNGPQDPTGRIVYQFLVNPSMRIDDVSFDVEMGQL